ncbi:MAG: 3-deoxy-7-phosphoheptulonate synthase [Clostridiales bacterium]|uniref:3-deoxy-7-phosphoheptulonate synthase n=1 Tax=Oscillospiraceae TaxID=216572 RepID=UPI0009A6EE01|nr:MULTISPECIES: 3-deoxy-7-phosphoheptulonate synthase [Oscillospiraceae]PWM37494.1 MAG: 3-deoxy-7-phosphoheptulonate synthase [Clostridiales bacterium]RGB69588.1 3-deoxy-7-phosphoheptulonate synthase [Harryflintia acetispora]
MVVILKNNIQQDKLDNFIQWLSDQGIEARPTKGLHTTILGLVGDTAKLDLDTIKAVSIVEDAIRIQEPYKNANRKFHPLDTVVQIGELKIGGGNFQVISGPCSVESEAQITEVADRVHKAGARLVRGGAFKPRTSPYAFQGLRAEGIELLHAARRKTGMPIVTEVMSASHLPLFEDVDVIQVGARNMQNFELLKELGKLRKPILLKRGLANTMEELLMSAEYIMAGGNMNVILCERGIRTFETATRNTLDISAVPMLKKLSHLPVVVDPSHAAGINWMVEPLSMAAIAAGADGLIIEVHNDPQHALSDGPQSLTPDQFDELMPKIKSMVSFMGKKMAD